MIDLIKKFFSAPTNTTAPAPGKDSQHSVLVATCALFLEMAEIDNEFARSECNHIIDILKKEYALDDGYAEELAKAALAERENSYDLWRFANLINQNYTNEEKIQIVELLWRLIYADGHLSDHEQYLITKLRKMLRLTHSQVIDAKLKVLDEHRSDG